MHTKWCAPRAVSTRGELLVFETRGDMTSSSRLTASGQPLIGRVHVIPCLKQFRERTCSNGVFAFRVALWRNEQAMQPGRCLYSSLARLGNTSEVSIKVVSLYILFFYSAEHFISNTVELSSSSFRS
jgi:hypothetical protein